MLFHKVQKNHKNQSAPPVRKDRQGLSLIQADSFSLPSRKSYIDEIHLNCATSCSLLQACIIRQILSQTLFRTCTRKRSVFLFKGFMPVFPSSFILLGREAYYTVEAYRINFKKIVFILENFNFYIILVRV